MDLMGMHTCKTLWGILPISEKLQKVFGCLCDETFIVEGTSSSSLFSRVGCFVSFNKLSSTSGYPSISITKRATLQGGPLPVINGVITPINGLING